MGLYNTKPAFREALRPLAKRWSFIHPDCWTWVAVGVSALAGALFLSAERRPQILLGIPLLLFLRLVLNVFDGVVAQVRALSSARGEALSEFADRLSDIVILGGFAASGCGDARLAAGAIVVVFLVSYVGILGKAVGAGRQYGGLMGKPDRMAVVGTACLLQYGALQGQLTPPSCWGFQATFFDWGSIVIVTLGLYTIRARLLTIFRTLETQL